MKKLLIALCVCGVISCTSLNQKDINYIEQKNTTKQQNYEAVEEKPKEVVEEVKETEVKTDPIKDTIKKILDNVSYETKIDLSNLLDNMIYFVNKLQGKENTVEDKTLQYYEEIDKRVAEKSNELQRKLSTDETEEIIKNFYYEMVTKGDK